MGLCSWNIAVIEYGNMWKSRRKLLHKFLNVRAVTQFDDYQRKHAYRLLSNLAVSPERFLDHAEL